MPTDEKQLNNVANRGDVFKHAALLRILRKLAKVPGRMLYCETHAFRPEAALSPPQAQIWRQAVNRLPRNATRDDYYSLEQPYVHRGRYLCSTGIALSVLADRGHQTDFLLCESSQESRTMLATALELHDLAPARWQLLEDNRLLLGALAGRTGYDAVAALIDPYQLAADVEEVPAWLSALAGCARAGAPVSVLVFDCHNRGWPEPLDDRLALRDWFQTGSFSLAMYGN